MQKVLLLGDSAAEIQEIYATLECNLPFDIFLKDSQREGLNLIGSKVINLIILECARFDDEKLQLASEFRRLGHSFPILIVANGVTSKKLEKGPSKLPLHFLSKPYLEKELLGVAKKLLSSRKIPQQQFRRYRTDQVASIETLMSGERIGSQLYNLSKGGAYCEVSDTNIKVGELLRLKIDLDNVDKHHTVNAKVVWVTKKGNFSGRPGLGLKFINNQEVHRHLMELV